MSRKQLPTTVLELATSHPRASIDRQRRVAGIIDQVKVKPSPDDPETPAPGALVRVSDLASGALAWQGYSDADGQYRASGLVDGRSYLITGHDLSGTYESVGAGPLAATPLLATPSVTVMVGQPCALDLRLQCGALQPLSAITWTDAQLPAGCTLDADLLHGDWPTGVPGSYGATLNITRGDTTRSQRLSINLVLLPLEISAPEMPDVYQLNEAIAPITFTASGGEGPYTFDVVGSLPSGLSLLDNEDGTATLGGTPDAQASYSFAVRATDVRAAVSSVPLSIRVAASASYRYWRVNVSANNGGAYLAIAEMQLRGAAGGSAYTGGTASASSEANASNVASYAFDGNASTKWAASVATGWLQYDLGATKVVREIAIMGNYAAGDQASFAPKNFTIEARDSTGDAWKTLETITNQTGWGAAETRTWSVADV